jgi:hypothetical protein
MDHTISTHPNNARNKTFAEQMADLPAETAADFIRLLHEPESVFEVRIPRCPHRRGDGFTSTASGYFTDPDAAAAQAIKADPNYQPQGVYITLNPVRRDLLARADGQLHQARHTTSDAEITRRRWFFLNLDPVRPPGISATENELTAALITAKTICAALSEEGWPQPIASISGNGTYLLYRVDLPNDDSTTDLLRRVLHRLADRFDTDHAKLDRSTYNASRIVKIMGTYARKGHHTAERPHRQAEFVAPASVEVVSVDQLRAVAEPAEPADQVQSPSGSGAVTRCQAFLSKMPDAVSGNHGHDHTFAAACRIWEFVDNDEQAMELLQWFNQHKCRPPWSEKELRHKLEDANKKVAEEGKIGCRLKQEPQDLSDDEPSHYELAVAIRDRHFAHPDRPLLLSNQRQFHTWNRHRGCWQTCGRPHPGDHLEGSAAAEPRADSTVRHLSRW